MNAAREMKELLDFSALIKKKLSGGKEMSSATPGETTPGKTTPGETTLSETTPGDTTPSEPPPTAVSSGPPVGPINIESSREDLMQSSERETAEPSVTDALKETISKLKQSDRLVRARNTVLNRKTSEFRAAIDKAATEQCRLLGGKKAQKEKFMEKFGELKDKFKNAAIDPYGSNVGLIDAGTATSLQTPTSSQGDHAIERSEDATAPLVLGPAPSMANLVVSEESLIPILGVSDANPTTALGLKEAGSEPVDQLELSYSSAEEEGGEKSDERVPGDNPQGTEEGLVDEVENPPASATDEAGGTSDQLKARAFVDVISELCTLRLFYVSDLQLAKPGFKGSLAHVSDQDMLVSGHEC
ncbi:hypothetical protein F2Q69_00005739 [Brassica cretica]|uniref:Uncharacterized protein n=1 Tax=Brassica cretica TaxID=69181 RepID=A0A8S9NPE5_BRACR|nr:hypothetical protein F2Q69_00005739 [Brassica cretica]